MKTINQEDFTQTLFALLKETFEGVPKEQGGFYIDYDTDIFTSIENLSAEDASNMIGDNEASIAAHLEHIRFYFDMLTGFINGNRNIIDYKKSWLVKSVDEEQWNELKEKTQTDYEKMWQILEGFEDWNAQKIGGAMAIVAHSAYHLGAIRQIIKQVEQWKLTATIS